MIVMGSLLLEIVRNSRKVVVASGKRNNRYMYVYHRFTTTVHTDVTVTQMRRAHYVVKREQIIVDTTFRNFLGGTGT
jgi:hypothetical protein